MTPASRETALQNITDFVSPEHLAPKARAALSNLEKHLDNLLFVDEGNDIAINRETFLALVRDEEVIPAKLRDVVVLESAKHLGRRLRTAPKSARKISWREGEKYGAVDRPGAAELREHGFKTSMSLEEMREALKKQYPRVPASLLEEDSVKLYPKLLETFERNRSVWDCVVSNLGWFAAIQIVGSIIILVLLLAAGVAGAVIAIILLAFAATLTVFILLSCAFNTNFQLG